MSSKHERTQPRFGELAVQKGYCAADQVEAALAIQQRHDPEGLPQRPIGHLMAQHGLITTGQHIALVRAHRRAQA